VPPADDPNWIKILELVADGVMLTKNVDPADAGVVLLSTEIAPEYPSVVTY
jgi:hypothetical protein